MTAFIKMNGNKGNNPHCGRINAGAIDLNAIPTLVQGQIGRLAHPTELLGREGHFLGSLEPGVVMVFISSGFFPRIFGIDFGLIDEESTLCLQFTLITAAVGVIIDQTG